SPDQCKIRGFLLNFIQRHYNPVLQSLFSFNPRLLWITRYRIHLLQPIPLLIGGLDLAITSRLNSTAIRSYFHFFTFIFFRIILPHIRLSDFFMAVWLWR